MVVTNTGRTEDRVNLLLVSVLLDALLSIVHDSHNILHLLIQTSEDVGLVANLENVSAEGGIHVEITELVVI